MQPALGFVDLWQGGEQVDGVVDSGVLASVIIGFSFQVVGLRSVAIPSAAALRAASGVPPRMLATSA